MSDARHAWPWERLAQSNAESHELLVELLEPQAGERWLDIGTGSGGVAIRAARAGAEVVGIDLAPQAIERARAAAPDVTFDVADAQSLPYDDASFDVVASAYGVNFAHDHRAAAAEIARVCRDRVGLTLMPPDSRAGELWTLIRSYGDDTGDHPAAWTAELLEPWFDVELRRHESAPEPPRDREEAWAFMSAHMGGLAALVARLDADAVADLKREFHAVGARYESEPRSYLLLLGRKR